MLEVGEVVETKNAYKTDQEDEYGNSIHDGSIRVRLGGHDSLAGNLVTVNAQPLSFNKKMPLVGEHVLIYKTLSNETLDSAQKFYRYYYLDVVNVNNNKTIHQLPGIFRRDKNKNKVTRTISNNLSDKDEVGYTIKKKTKQYTKLQPFEGDDIWEGRFGQSVRFSRHCERVNENGLGIYEQNPSSFWKGKSADDPLLIINLSTDQSGGYKLEDLSSDEASIYLTTSHKLLKFKPGFSKNTDVKQISNWDKGSGLLLNADRIVLNAKSDMAFLISSKETIVTAPQVLFQSNKYKVYLDDLMDWLEEAYGELWKLATAQAQFMTAMGPTAAATNAAQITKLHKAEWVTKFKTP